MIPHAAYPQNIVRYVLIVCHFNSLFKKWSNHPDEIIPKAVPAVPINEYQAYMSPLFAAGVSCASVDSSIARNGPISFPLFPVSFYSSFI